MSSRVSAALKRSNSNCQQMCWPLLILQVTLTQWGPAPCYKVKFTFLQLCPHCSAVIIYKQETTDTSLGNVHHQEKPKLVTFLFISKQAQQCHLTSVSDNCTEVQDLLVQAQVHLLKVLLILWGRVCSLCRYSAVQCWTNDLYICLCNL